MALRQGLNNAKEKTPLLRGVTGRYHAPVHPPVKTVLAIVFVCACVHGCGRQAPSAASGSYHAYDVLVTRQSDTYYPRTYRAVFATDERRCRIAFYWLDPVEEIEPMDVLASSDFLFDANQVWYWQHKDAKRTHTSRLEAHSPGQVIQLPRDQGFESILGSILTLIVRNRAPDANLEGPMEACQFFLGIREHHCLKHTTKPPGADATSDALVSAWAKGDGAILDRLPFGRTYSKETGPDGSVRWRMSKTAVVMERVRVTIRPMPLRNMSGWSEVGDPNTLGRWSAVPEAYRRYWSLRDQSISLRGKPNAREAQQFYAEISSVLRGALPDDVNSPLRELLFRTSLYTGSDEAARSSAGEYFSAYVHLAQEPVERIVIELGRIGQELRTRWSDDQTRDFIRPLLKGIVDPKVFGDPEFVKEYILRRIQTQGPTWAWYEQLVRETVQDATGVRLESTAGVRRVPAERNRGATATDGEPNDPSTSADGQEHE